jgi:hypothetical protein
MDDLEHAERAAAMNGLVRVVRSIESRLLSDTDDSSAGSDHEIPKH